MTHTMDEINDAVPGGVLMIMAECGCFANVYLLERRPHIEYCQLHKAAPQLLEALRSMCALYELWDTTPIDDFIGEYNKAQAAIAAAEGAP